MASINFSITAQTLTIPKGTGPNASSQFVQQIDVTPAPDVISSAEADFDGKKYTVDAGTKSGGGGYISFSSDEKQYLPVGDYVFVTETRKLYTQEQFNDPTVQKQVAAEVKTAQRQPDLAKVAAALSDIQVGIKALSASPTFPQGQQQTVDAIIDYYAPTLKNPPEAPSEPSEPTPVSDESAKDALNNQTSDEVPPTPADLFLKAAEKEDFRNFILLGRDKSQKLTDPNAAKLYDNFLFMLADLSIDGAVLNNAIDAISGDDEEAESEAELVVSEAEFTTGQQQVVALLKQIDTLVDNPQSAIKIGDFPGRPNTGDLDVAALITAYGASEFNPGEIYNKEVKDAIAAIAANSTELSSGEPFINRPGIASRIPPITQAFSKSSNDTIANFLTSFGGPYFNHLLSQPANSGALKLLKAGRSDKLTDPSQKRFYKNVIKFTTLFGTQGALESMLDDATVNDDGTVSAPAAGTPGSTGTSATEPSTGGTSPTGGGGESGVATPGAPTGVGSSGALAVGGGGTASPSAAGGAPGSAAPVNPIAIGVVQILNAQPAKISLSIVPANKKDDQEVAIPVWEIPPEYFSGYRLEINDTFRPFVEVYKGSQAVLKITATPITGGRPVQLSRPITIRPYILPKQLGEIPVTTFAVGRLMGGVTINPDPAEVGGAVDFDGRDGEVPCLYFKADGGAASAEGDNVSVRTSANGRTYSFTFTSGFLVPVRIKIDPSNKKQAAALAKIKSAQGIDKENVQESKRLIKEGGVPHWIFLKPGRKSRGGGAGSGGADAGEDDTTSGGLAVNIGVRKIVVSTDIKYRIVGNVGDPWDESSFKVELFPGSGTGFPRGDFSSPGIILCADDVRDLGLANMVGGIKELKASMFQVLFTMNAPTNTPYKRMGASRWVQDARVAGGNPSTSVTAREKPRRLGFAT